MVARSRTPAERDAELPRIRRMYIRGLDHQEMECQLKLSRTQVNEYLQEVRHGWVEHQSAETQHQRALALAKIDYLEATAWEAWDRSCAGAESYKTVNDGTKKRVERNVKDKIGLPKFLDQVAWCITKRSLLLGLVPSEKAGATKRHADATQEELDEQCRQRGLHSPHWRRALKFVGAESPTIPAETLGSSPLPTEIEE